MKRGFPRGLVVVLFALVILIGGVIFLATTEVPPPVAPYERALDLHPVAVSTPVATPAPAASAPAAAPAGTE